MRELRPYQANAIAAVRQAIGEGEKRIVLASPTGAGKTVIAGAIVGGALAKNRRVLFCVPAISLVDQTVASFWAEGFDQVGVIQASHHMTDWSKPVQVASVQTLMRKDRLPEADVILIDECHRLFTWYSNTFTTAWKDKPIIGLSATPWTRGLGKLYNRLIIATTTAELIEREYLCPFRVFAPSHPDLSKVRTVAGDYHEGDLSGVMGQQVLVADVVQTWLKSAEGRSTFCFAVDCAHARLLQEQFAAAGVSTAYIDANTPLPEREAIKDQFHDGRVRVVCNVGVLTTGIDWDVRCIVLARPTKSEMLYVQMIGRGLRTAEAKDDCLILDHSDTTLRLGFVTDIHHEQLDDGREKAKATGVERVRLPKECPQCAMLKPPNVRACPGCGFEPIKTSSVETQDGELVEVTGRKKGGRGKSATDRMSTQERIVFFRELQGIGFERGYKRGWAAAQYKSRFGTWPPNGHDDQPIAASEGTRSWVRSRMIAWAKSQRNPANAPHHAA